MPGSPKNAEIKLSSSTFKELWVWLGEEGQPPSRHNEYKLGNYEHNPLWFLLKEGGIT